MSVYKQIIHFSQIQLQQWKSAWLGRKVTNASEEGQCFTWQPVCGDVGMWTFPLQVREQLVGRVFFPEYFEEDLSCAKYR